MAKKAAIAGLIREGTPIKFGSTADHKSCQIKSVSQVQNAADEISVFDLRKNVFANGLDIFVRQSEKEQRIDVDDGVDVAAVDVDPA